jgi:hypothetical protein
MTDTWHRIPCDASSCPEWRRWPDGNVGLRNSARPITPIWFTAAEWAALIAAAKNGDLDQDTP